MRLTFEGGTFPCLVSLIATSLLLGCSFDPNVPLQTSFQLFDDRQLTVGFVTGVYDPAPVVTEGGEEISPFPIVGADGIRVQDPGPRPLTEDDLALARRAAAAHCAEFGQSLAPGTGVFYPAEASFLFGRCIE